MADRIIYDGPPGTVWTNTTPKLQYQFQASLHNTCGACLQYHGKIGGRWPIPLHFGCNCNNVEIPAGQTAPDPFVDFRELLDKMPPEERAKAVGKSNYRLIKEGVVEWKDVVTPSRVRDLREVVSIKKLSVKTMVDAGVKPVIAQEAHRSVNTAAHQLADQTRKELVQKLTGAGVSHEKLVQELTSRITGGVTIAPGPLQPPPPGSPEGGARFAGVARQSSARLGRAPRRRAGEVPRPRHRSRPSAGRRKASA